MHLLNLRVGGPHLLVVRGDRGGPLANEVDCAAVLALVLELPPVIEPAGHAEAGYLDGGLCDDVVTLDDIFVPNAHGEVVADVLHVVGEGLVELRVFASVLSNLGLKLLHAMLDLNEGVLSAEGLGVSGESCFYDCHVE